MSIAVLPQADECPTCGSLEGLDELEDDDFFSGIQVGETTILDIAH